MLAIYLLCSHIKNNTFNIKIHCLSVFYMHVTITNTKIHLQQE